MKKRLKILIARRLQRQVARYRGAELGVGARGSVDFLVQSLELAYGTRRPTGFSVYGSLRPRR